MHKLTLVLLDAVDGEEVDDSGGKVQGDVVFVLLNGQTVAVAVAGSGHASTVQQDWGPGARHTIKDGTCRNDRNHFF